jgi:hypothetical protein
MDWKTHVKLMLHKLEMLCSKEYEKLRMIYHAYFHSIMKYGIILGGNSPGAKKFSFDRKRL